MGKGGSNGSIGSISGCPHYTGGLGICARVGTRIGGRYAWTRGQSKVVCMKMVYEKGGNRLKGYGGKEGEDE